MDGLPVDVVPQGWMLLISSPDVPGMIGKVLATSFFIIHILPRFIYVTTCCQVFSLLVDKKIGIATIPLEINLNKIEYTYFTDSLYKFMHEFFVTLLNMVTAHT